MVMIAVIYTWPPREFSSQLRGTCTSLFLLVVMPAERPKGIRSLYVSPSLSARKKCPQARGAVENAAGAPLCAWPAGLPRTDKALCGAGLAFHKYYLTIITNLCILGCASWDLA